MDCQHLNTFGQRLRDERTRLGLTQEAFGALGGVRKQAQIKYENGTRKPDSSYFEGIAAAGADIGYILTGSARALRERLQNVRPCKGNGYRELSEAEVSAINTLKDQAEAVGAQLDALSLLDGIDRRALAIAKTELQTGFMWAVRAVTKPSTF
ncbi:TPA: helix-turn-helix transcriptional regulator [Stenotrophomonas maltophilia]|nr:helix-turn-helix transcriptional regulator [Stenotrophomonas maltophilia]HEL7728509.1 helix-turn-helix transcriptional regulator [Stenotrophomonas maltophilia]